MPKLEKISIDNFELCLNLTNLSLLKVEIIEEYVFSGC